MKRKQPIKDTAKVLAIVCWLWLCVTFAMHLGAEPVNTYTQTPRTNTMFEVLNKASTLAHTTAKDISESMPKLKSLGTFRVTAYCSCEKCCGVYATTRPLDEAGNPIVYGASGEVLIPEYSVAVDPDVIPYGTKLYMNGKGYIAHDCGGLIDGNDLDLYFTSHEDAWNWGCQYIEVFVLVKDEP